MNGTTQIIKANRYLLWIVFWLFLASVCLSQNAKAPLIANLTRSHMTGCGCYFGFPEREGSWVLEADDGDSVAWVNINGVDTKLKLDRSTFAQKEFEVRDLLNTFVRRNENYRLTKVLRCLPRRYAQARTGYVQYVMVKCAL